MVFGKASGFSKKLALASLNGSNGFQLDGASAGDFTGWSVAGAGDVNGDGFADVIIGAFGAEPDGKHYAGSSYVVFGKKSGFKPRSKLSSLDGSNGFRLDGAAVRDFSGWSVAAARYVNGDGFADLIIGAPFAHPDHKPYAGSSYVVFGKKSGFAPKLKLSSLDGGNGFRLHGASDGDRGGVPVAGARDINGDGFAELPGPIPRENPTQVSPYVVFGRGP